MNPSSALHTLIAGLRFYSRLPLPPVEDEADAHAPPDLDRLAPVVPLVGAVLGGLAGLVLVPATWLWPPVIAAILCVAAAIVMTGAFHEDGLADTADSFGGYTVEKRLEIMRDSRIGTFGASALGLGLLLRVALIAALVDQTGAWATMLALVAAGALSRTAALSLFVQLDPARPDGAAQAAGRPGSRAILRSQGLAAILAMLVLPAAGPQGVFAAVVVAAATALMAVRFARTHLGGHTGDVAGATQQVGEIAILLSLLALAPSGALT
ncbi:adenosylcobinamide-GDP ribazoletransferase [Phreatobacter sp.]|uniref:adenosylcobinamide-GDP ribazoletransferase n=1 Tax=Phreatobacter sp. TaxID=1966341 RepID=UPI003F6FC1CD